MTDVPESPKLAFTLLDVRFAEMVENKAHLGEGSGSS